MSQRHLDRLFHPTSVAVIGASDQAHSVGAVVMRNLLAGNFAGPIMPVNPKHASIAGVLSYPDVGALPVAPDLAVICTAPPAIPETIAALGARGTRAAVVITAGLSRQKGADGRSLQQAMLEAARPHVMRVLGPNCVGLLVPGVNLNASFAHAAALPGRIAFVSQSGALCTAVLDWARSAGIGFSHFVSLGDSADVDFGDVLDYLAADAGTRAIMIYVESVSQARKFMSAARGAARNKPVVAIKSGRVREAEQAAASHTGALAGNDEVYSAAFRRAGILRVDTTAELFEAVETLARARYLPGERLAIITNGGGPGVMAVDDLIRGGGQLAAFAPETMAALDRALPSIWSHGNPLDVVGDAPAGRFSDALRIVAKDAGVDALLAMHAPTAIVPAAEVAEAVIQASKETRKNVLTCWLGRDAAAPARRLFAEAGLPTFDTPDSAVRAFLHMAEYRRSQELLMETPPAAAEDFVPDTAAARAIFARALDAGRIVLTEPEAKAVLAAYRIPVVRTLQAADGEAAVRQAEALGFPVALKILSPDISHKSDVGGVALDLEGPNAVRRAAAAMQARIARLKPAARLEGFTVQPMVRRLNASELILGVATDPIFGPVVLFGQGGTAVEVIEDRAVALPPLNLGLARELVSRTRVAKLLAGYRDRPAIDHAALQRTLVQVSQMVIDLPELAELDINPLFADADGVLALDARIRLAPTSLRAAERLSISPYPQDLAEALTLGSGRTVTLRPIRPEDEPAHQAFFSHLKPEDVRFRFFGVVRQLSHSQTARFTQIDYDREMAFIATAAAADGTAETLGVARSISDPDNQQCEFAIIVRSDMKGQGLGSALMRKLIRYARGRGTQTMVGQVLYENRPMLALVERLGFTLRSMPGSDAVEVRLDLTRP
ncbi:MAG TPA: GNAT family N-acetyltransferase [Candidatus Sulfotelmatobacter sp.]|nr:GNAT family N-acetyltransferase [Candidatus Sulfotelmatobacter sp.]